MSKRLTQEEFLSKVHKLNPNLEVIDPYVNAKTKLRVRCKKCGREWTSLGGSLTIGYGCLHCASVAREDKKRISTQTFAEKLRRVNDQLAVIGEYTGAQNSVVVKCEICGLEFSKQANHLLEGSGCPSCWSEWRRKKLRLSQAQFSDMLADVHPDIQVSKEEGNFYIDQMTPIKFTCSNGHTFYRRPNNMLVNQSGCPTCREPSGEKKIRQFLEKNSIDFEAQKKFPDCIDKFPLPFDFYLPQYNMAIEFDGQQHYRPVKFYGGDDDFELRKNHDATKTKYCLDNGIKLIRIPYFDFSNIEHILSKIILDQPLATLCK